MSLPTSRTSPRYVEDKSYNEPMVFPSDAPLPGVNLQPFAGRIGGNQQFTLSTSDPSYQSSLEKTPDAGRDTSWKALLDLRGFREPDLWRTASFEGIGTALQTFIGGLIGVGLVPTVTETSVGAVFPVTYAALANMILVALFIYAAGPVSGAHLNPLISMATFLTRLSSLPRTVLYILFQCAGAVVGAFLLRASLGASPGDLAVIPGCYIDTALVTPGEAYAFETMASFSTLFLAFGLGLDPRNGSSVGPTLAPLLVGLSAALVIFAGGIARKGYLGSSGNPARCLGLMSAAGRFDYHYIHWVGDISAAIINAVLYFVVPPYKN